MPTVASKNLERLEHDNHGRDTEVTFICEEFTCLCPRTGQPDFATVKIVYVPAKYIVELKSLKLYFWSYRDTGIFHETVANQVMDDLVALLQPKRMQLEFDFKIRGGIHTIVRCSHPA